MDVAQSGSNSKRRYQLTSLEDEGESGLRSGQVLFKKTGNTEPKEMSIPQPKKLDHCPLNNNKEALSQPSTSSQASSSSQNASSTKGTETENKFGKSYAQSFAYQKEDMYKLPPKPVAAAQVVPKNSNSIIVNGRQRGNPILKNVKNVPWEYGDIIPDYQIGERHCVLFLSLRYHNLNPDYIHDRLKLLGNRYDLRVILVQVDVKNCKHNLKELGKICLLAGCTLILSWSAEEAGRYLETYKQYENKPPDILQERVETDYFTKIQDVLTTVKSINKTDAITLLSNFGSLKNIINATKEEIELCPGFGQQKAQRLYKAFTEPFKRTEGSASMATVNVSISPSKKKLGETSKLKRPSEHEYLKECLSLNAPLSPPKSKRKSHHDNETVTKSSITSGSASNTASHKKSDVIDSPAKSSEEYNDNSICNVISIDDDDCIADQLSEILPKSPTRKIIQHSSKTSTQSKNSLPKEKDSSLSPKHSKPDSKPLKQQRISKSDAVYKSGLSIARNRKETKNTHPVQIVSGVSNIDNIKDTEPNPQKKRVLPVTDSSPPKKMKPYKTLSSSLLSSSKISSKTVPKASTISSPPETVKVTTTPTKKTFITNKKSPVVRNIDPVTGKTRISNNMRRESESADVGEKSEGFNQQITNEEFEDLLADDDDDDDDMMI